MNSLEIANRYFDAWNRRDPEAVLATMAVDGTYTDPTTNGPLSGDAFAAYMKGLFSTFPDTSFEIVSEGQLAPDLVAAQWIMRGTNHGSMRGLPPTGKSIQLHGADFIRVIDGKIRSVDGYFDSGVIPLQLGLQVIVQPDAIGPFTFGTSIRVSGGKDTRPGAFSVTALRPRNAEDVKTVTELSRQIGTELLSMPGFIAFVGVTVGDRMLTISAWEDPQAPAQLLRGGTHAEAMKRFWAGVSETAYTAVLVPERMNTRWARCPACGKMADHVKTNGVCECGSGLVEPISYW
ncbi:MAG TPA: ester cyclase [Terriglobia bacterium]|nr:ester cyclase [Terriglobia bacterium]